MFKKLGSFLMAGVIAVSLAACGAQDSGSPSSAQGSKTLTIATMKSDRFLEAAIEKYKQQHSDINIEVKEYSTSQDPQMPEGAGKGGNGKGAVFIGGPRDNQDVEKYVNSVNTELMTGKAADIISLGDLPYKKYADKGMLVNLSDMMKQDSGFDVSKYHTNLFDALKYKGNSYVLPLSYRLKVLNGDKAALAGGGVTVDGSRWTWQDFVSAAEKLLKDVNGEKYALTGISENDLLAALVGSSFDRFVDMEQKKADFTSQEFIELLKLCKDMIDRKLVNISAAEGKIMDMASRGNTLFTMQDLRMFMDFQAQGVMFNGGAEVYPMPSVGGTGGMAFASDMIYGINSKTKMKQEAWDFLKFLLSDEMQSAMELASFPVSKKAGEDAAKRFITMSSGNGGKMKLMINGKQLEPKPLTQQDIDLAAKLTGEVSRYYTQDSQILKMIQEEAAPFLRGQKSAEDAAKLIQSRVSTYLAE